MKISNKVLLTVLATIFTLGLVGLVIAATQVDLGTAEDFAVLAGTDINDTNPSTITGHVGLDPATGAQIDITCGEVTGTIYDNNGLYVGDGDVSCRTTDAALLTTAKGDLVDAYNDAAGQVTTGVIAADLGGQTLFAGVYEDNDAPDSLAITGTLTLDAEGDPDAVFILKSGSTLTTAANSVVNLINEAQACNVFWQITSSATLGTDSNFAGSILALVSITDNGGSTVDGRLLARNGAVTLNNTTVDVPSCTAAATLNVIKAIVGSSASPADFNVYVKEGGVDVTDSPQVGEAAPGTLYSLSAGTYVVSEDAANDFTQSFSGDCDANGSVTLVAGNDYTCTVTNTSHGSSGGSGDISTTLNVIKRVVNGNGGTADPSDFDIYVKEGGVDVTGSPQVGEDAPGTLYSLSAGTYVVSEDANASYTQSFSGDCDANGSVTLATGDNETCTITNTDILALVPGLPSTGVGDNSTPWNIVIPAGIFVALYSFYLVRKKQVA